jgi:peptidoglycan/xylan/chitin deacetylase (PgdA/CDA1 family)
MKYNEKILNSPDVIWQGSSPGLKQAALTFDDGPDDYWTPQILDQLSRYNVQATFFCLGDLIQQNSSTLQKIVEKGHIIGNHSWNHPSLPEISLDEMRMQIERTNDEIYRVIGLRPHLFRPPYGDLDEITFSEILSLNFKIVLWKIDSQDYLGLTGLQITANVLSKVQPGTIILMHCAAYDHQNSMAGTVEALPTIIETLSNEGYDIVPISQLANIPAYL